jgi:hypothetical protein
MKISLFLSEKNVPAEPVQLKPIYITFALAAARAINCKNRLIFPACYRKLSGNKPSKPQNCFVVLSQTQRLLTTTWLITSRTTWAMIAAGTNQLSWFF